jgi:hypothetical protein
VPLVGDDEGEAEHFTLDEALEQGRVKVTELA